MRVLLVDDEPSRLERLERELQAAGHEVIALSDGARARELAYSVPCEIAVLDEDLTCRSGSGACQALVTAPHAPYIIMVSRYTDLQSRLRCLHCGADDYLSKPFADSELLARIHAAVRRLSRELTYRDLKLDLDRRRIVRQGKDLTLTNREFELLAFFMRHPEQPLSRDRLSAEVWNMPFATGTNVIDVYVTYLRRKLSRLGAPLIKTVRGIGYCLGPTD